MPIPPFLPSGLLEPGLHEASLEEVKARFGRFQRTDRRVYLMAALERYVAEAQRSEVALEVLVDGSFVTGKDEPGDVDCILVLKPGADLEGTLKPCVYNVVSKRMVLKRHGIEAFAFPAGSSELQGWVEYFSQMKDRSGQRKGLVRIRL